ncbi:MAG: hypothetical protein U0905_17830 [Pirellulales bacterium]
MNQNDMQVSPVRTLRNRPHSRVASVNSVLVAAAACVVSPYFTLRFFHPDGAAILEGMKTEQLVDLQISQLEPLLLSISTLWYLLACRKVSSRFLWVSIVVTLHMFVAFWLVAIRGK